jgi:hypothetical protein
LSRISEDRSTENAIPVSWLSTIDQEDQGTDHRPPPQRLGTKDTEAAEATEIETPAKNAKKPFLRFPSISPRSWIQ